LNTKLKGIDAEELICNKIRSWNFKIVDRNFHVKFGEIDIIAYDNDTLCFIEVRSKFDSTLGHPAATVNIKKQQTIRKIAEYYIIQNRLFDISIRFDVATIVWNKSEILYFKNAF
jgi:putative endonuclease